MLGLSFPPARPSVNNLKAACLYGSGRPRYPASFFPSSSYAYARRAGKAVNRLESWLGQCCYGRLARGAAQILCCAEQAVSTQHKKHVLSKSHFTTALITRISSEMYFYLCRQWETALAHFCIEEYSTKTLAHECCEKKGKERWNCFERQAPNPSYKPLSGYIAPIIKPDRIFTWKPNAC